MTRDEIVEIAWDVGLFMRSHKFQDEPTKLERFAERIAAEKEQQMIRDGYRQCAKGQRTTQFCGLLDAAVKAEREACAKVCEKEQFELTQDVAGKNGLQHFDAGCRSCAEMIRRRGGV